MPVRRNITSKDGTYSAFVGVLHQQIAYISFAFSAFVGVLHQQKWKG
jgi:hypothetical protein